MSPVATTKLSSKGQVVIPEDIRDQLGLKEGQRFVVFGHGDTVILKGITAPSQDQLGKLVDQLRADIRRAGIKQSALPRSIRKVRREKSNK